MTELGAELTRQISDVAEAFSRQSEVYDEYEVENENLKRVRDEIYAHFLSLIDPRDRVLEVNAGTGTDAVELAQRSFRIHATDVAAGMVAEIDKKVQAAGLGEQITTQVLSFTNLAKTKGGPYQSCFSNIGGLNCIPDLKVFAEQLPNALGPGAVVTMVIMPRLCPWEWLEIFRGRFGVAFRRWKRGGAVVSPKGIPYRIYYHSPRHVKSAFRGKYRLIRQQSLSLFSPPMDRKQFSKRHPTLYRFLVWLDNRVSSAFPFNQLGDFIVYSFRYEPSSADLAQEPPLRIGKRVGKNATWLLAGRALSQLLTFLVTILIARRLGVAVLGQYAFITSLIFLFNGISTLGTDVLLVREIAARRDFSYFLPSLVVQLAVSALAILLIFAISPFWPQQADVVAPMRIYSLSLIPLAFFTVFGAALRGKEEMGAYSVLTVLLVLLQVVGILLLPGRGAGIVGLMTVLLIAQFAVAAVAAWLAFAKLPDLRGAWRATRAPIGAVLRAGAAIAAFGILATAYQRLSLYFVGSMQDAAATGWFAAALRVVEAPKFVHVAVLSALLPAMSQAHADDAGAKFRHAFGLSFGWLALFSILFAVPVFVFAAPLTLFLFGDEFAATIAVLKVVIWSLIPFALSQYVATQLLAARREKQVIASLLVAIPILAILCVLWIPQAGIIGAAWAMLAAEILLAALLFFFWWYRIRGGNS